MAPHASLTLSSTGTIFLPTRPPQIPRGVLSFAISFFFAAFGFSSSSGPWYSSLFQHERMSLAGDVGTSCAHALRMALSRLTTYPRQVLTFISSPCVRSVVRVCSGPCAVASCHLSSSVNSPSSSSTLTSSEHPRRTSPGLTTPAAVPPGRILATTRRPSGPFSNTSPVALAPPSASRVTSKTSSLLFEASSSSYLSMPERAARSSASAGFRERDCGTAPNEYWTIPDLVSDIMTRAAVSVRVTALVSALVLVDTATIPLDRSGATRR
mmetsp:Transcript_5720/g.23638  ORF Transcript_5720/g.23638 Transcript_5720/m.23638 type:complete len:268 (-) Transcript_5720:241-1044(-)